MKEAMNINRSNYEAYFLDYYEKTLDTTGVAELMVFLEANPELKEEFEGFELLFVNPDPKLVFEDKESLKKKSLISTGPINDSNYEEYLIASVEKVLSTEEEKHLAEFIRINPSVVRELELFRMTVLQPDTQIVFDTKDLLKHEESAPIISMRSNKGLYAFLAVAASLTILIVLYLSFGNSRKGEQYAQQAGPHGKESVGKVGSKATPNVRLNNDEMPKANQTSPPTTALAGTRTASPNLKATVLPEGNQKEETILLADASISSIPSRMPKSLENPHAKARKIKSSKRTEYSDIFCNYMLRNHIEYAQLLDEQASRPYIARTFSKLRQGITGEDEFSPDGSADQNVLWSVADIGVKGFNAITNSDFRLVRKINSEGKTQSYAVKSERMEYSKKLEK